MKQTYVVLCGVSLTEVKRGRIRRAGYSKVYGAFARRFNSLRRRVMTTSKQGLAQPEARNGIVLDPAQDRQPHPVNRR